jgi:hypothetical protein
VIRCNGKTTAGNPCKLPPIKGGRVCWKHGGSAPQVRAHAAVRAELSNWGLGDTHTDPGETLLRLVSQSAARAERYAQELESMVAESDSLRKALVSQAYTEFGPAGDFVRGLVILESQERDRLGNFCIKAIAAGLQERQVRLAERTGAMIADVMRAVLGDASLGLTVDQRAVVPMIMRKHIMAIAA